MRGMPDQVGHDGKGGRRERGQTGKVANEKEGKHDARREDTASLPSFS